MDGACWVWDCPQHTIEEALGNLPRGGGPQERALTPLSLPLRKTCSLGE